MSSTMNSTLRRVYSWVLASPFGFCGGLFAVLGLVMLVFSPSATRQGGLIFLTCGLAAFAFSVWQVEYRRAIISRSVCTTGQATYYGKSGTGIRSNGVLLWPTWRVEYDYTVDGTAYHGRTALLWLPPVVPEGKQITVYYDEASPAKSAVDYPII